GPIQETSGSFQFEGANPSPPEAGGSFDGQSGSGSDSSLPPPPGYSSGEKSIAGSDDATYGGGPPPPPGSGNNQSKGTYDMRPPESAGNIGNTDVSPAPPAVETDAKPSGKKGKGNS